MSPVEVVLIGPGYGESVLLNLGDECWIVVDSCVRRNSHGSLALEYLVERGVDVSKHVRMIIASHWHDDHVRGLATVVEACTSSRFVCSSALRRDEFLALLNHSISVSSRFSSGVEEFRNILSILESRKQSPIWANGARRVLLSPTRDVEAVWTLSPSDRDTLNAMRNFVAVATDNKAASRIPAIPPNDAAVAVIVELANGESVLLGADLEHHVGASDRGWHAVINDSGRPRVSSTLYKVAHHGSANAHCPSMWLEGSECDSRIDDESPSLLVTGETVCILAPWRRGRSRLPKKSDVERLARLSASVNLTVEDGEVFGESEEVKKHKAYGFARYMAPATPDPGILLCGQKFGKWSVVRVEGS